MSKLIFIRHGQASFMQENYDLLSNKGEAQAKRLGEHLVAFGPHFDRIYAGPLVRQQQTAEIVHAVFTANGLDIPPIETVIEMEEHHGPAVVEQAMPFLLEQDPKLMELVNQTKDGNATGRTYFKIYEIVLRKWVTGELDEITQEVESWPAFNKKVAAGVQQIKSSIQVGETVGVFTSGGTISSIVGSNLGLQAEKILELNSIVNNSSMTDFLVSGDRFTLNGFNRLPHLTDKEMITLV